MSCCSCFSFASGNNVQTSGRGVKGLLKGGDLEQEKQKSQREIAEFHTGLDFISKVPLFKTLQLSDHPALAKAFVTNSYSNGRAVIRQGDVGDFFFIIKSGQAAVIINDEMVNTLGPGDYFGEQALLHNTTRNATISAIGNLECRELSREDFDRLDLRKKLRFKKRKAVIQIEEQFSRKSGASIVKTAEEEKMIIQALRRNKNLGSFLPAQDDNLKAIVAEAYAVSVPAGTDIIKQHDINANLFYILESGTAEAHKEGEGKVADYNVKGESFGGLALLYQAPRAATVKVTSTSKLWCIPRAAMRAALQSQVAQRLEGFVKSLDLVDMFKEVSAADKRTLADALVETTFYKDEFVIKEGEEGDKFYILEEGELEVTKQGKYVSNLKPERSYLSRGSARCFGERALFQDEPRAASIRVVSSTATVLVLGRDSFLKVVRPRKTTEDVYGDLSSAGFVKYDFGKLTTMGLLGCGGFGKVTLVRDGVTGKYFALKMLSKGHVLQERQAAGVMNEKKILRMTHSPFLVQVAATFNRKDHLAFLLEPAMGGELFTLYIKNQFYGKENMAMFYGACVLKGLEHLHERSIIYRDMKPENLLLDTKGYCKIADFGLAKFVIGKTFTTCGTPDYFAPELLKGSGHTFALDWWTLGILIYEFMTGATPFSADDLSLMFSKMSRGIDYASAFAHSSPKNWHELVKGLCKLNPSERLPVRPGGVANVMEHRWYKSVVFSWPDLMKRTMKAPWDPKVKITDLSNFDAHDEEAPPEITYRDPKNGWDADFEDVYGPSTFE